MIDETKKTDTASAELGDEQLSQTAGGRQIWVSREDSKGKDDCGYPRTMYFDGDSVIGRTEALKYIDLLTKLKEAFHVRYN